MENYTAYIDGSCIGNPGPGGIGVIIVKGLEEIVETVAKSIPRETTNNMMELIAAIVALKVCPKGDVQIVTDSQYVVKGITERIEDWKERDWRTSENKPVKHITQWQLLEAEIHAREGKVVWSWLDQSQLYDPFHEDAHEMALRAAQKAAKHI